MVVTRPSIITKEFTSSEKYKRIAVPEDTFESPNSSYSMCVYREAMSFEQHHF
jgi:hypothetical protein